MKVAVILYELGGIATFVFLTFFAGYHYTWWNWLIALPVNGILASMWPIYWIVLRGLFGMH